MSLVQDTSATPADEQAGTGTESNQERKAVRSLTRQPQPTTATTLTQQQLEEQQRDANQHTPQTTVNVAHTETTQTSDGAVNGVPTTSSSSSSSPPAPPEVDLDADELRTRFRGLQLSQRDNVSAPPILTCFPNVGGASGITRPRTRDTTVARRLIMGALGLSNEKTVEQKEAEKLKRQQHRENKRKEKQQQQSASPRQEEE